MVCWALCALQPDADGSSLEPHQIEMDEELQAELYLANKEAIAKHFGLSIQGEDATHFCPMGINMSHNCELNALRSS